MRTAVCDDVSDAATVWLLVGVDTADCVAELDDDGEDEGELDVEAVVEGVCAATKAASARQISAARMAAVAASREKEGEFRCK